MDRLDERMSSLERRLSRILARLAQEDVQRIETRKAAILTDDERAAE